MLLSWSPSLAGVNIYFNVIFGKFHSVTRMFLALDCCCCCFGGRFLVCSLASVLKSKIFAEDEKKKKEKACWNEECVKILRSSGGIFSGNPAPCAGEEEFLSHHFGRLV